MLTCFNVRHALKVSFISSSPRGEQSHVTDTVMMLVCICTQAAVKGDLLCKNHFYKVFEHSCVAAVCENNQPIMVKIHPLIFL